MYFTMLLRILMWIAVYVLAIETDLEVRAYYRGFDTLLLGNFRRTDPIAKPADVTAVTLGSGAQSDGKRRLWIASSSHAEDSYLDRESIFPTILEKHLNNAGIRSTVINASHAGMDIEDNIAD